MIKSLEETIELMQSEDFKERFKAEYWQTRIRYNNLLDMLVKLDAGTLNFEPKCSKDLLRHQANVMGQYLYDLAVRAQIEGVDLDI